MAYEEFEPSQKYSCLEYLKMLRRLLPSGPLWDRLRIAPCLAVTPRYWVKVAESPSSAPAGLEVMVTQTYGGRIWMGTRHTDGTGRLWQWFGSELEISLAADTYLGQELIYALEPYGGYLMVGTGRTGALLKHTPGSGFWSVEAPMTSGQTDLFSLRTSFYPGPQPILYIGTYPNGLLLKNDIWAPGSMTPVLPQAAGKWTIHYMDILNNKLYGVTESMALFEWDFAAGTWTVLQDGWMDTIGGWALRAFNGSVFVGTRDHARIGYWDGASIVELPRSPYLDYDSSLHFLREHNGKLYGVTMAAISGAPPTIEGGSYLIEVDSNFNYQISALTPTANGIGMAGLESLNGKLYGIQTDGTIWEAVESPETSWLGRLLSCFASELSRFEADVVRLQRESVPGLSVELLSDWERIAGLPDICTPPSLTTAQRQANVHTKIYLTYSGLSSQFFIDYAAGLGITITISDVSGGDLFRTGHKTDGRIQRVTQMPPPDGIDDSRLNSSSVQYQWVVDVVSDPGGNRSLMECVFNKIKPAWTQVIFTP